MATNLPSCFFFKEKNALPTKISPYDLKPHPIYRVGAVVGFTTTCAICGHHH
jgi:hypothetical protein